MSSAEKIQEIKNVIGSVTLVAVSKTKPISLLQEAYDGGQRIFGENRVQELADKFEALPKDIQWHMIGHLQSNKVKYIAPFVHLIHAVDSESLLKEIQKQALKNNRTIDCLLQVHIAKETNKFGFSAEELLEFISRKDLQNDFPNISFKGLMGMATFSDDQDLVRSEFRTLKSTFDTVKAHFSEDQFTEISMGMSGDYLLAIEEGSTMVRIGSSIFGGR